MRVHVWLVCFHLQKACTQNPKICRSNRRTYFVCGANMNGQLFRVLMDVNSTDHRSNSATDEWKVYSTWRIFAVFQHVWYYLPQQKLFKYKNILRSAMFYVGGWLSSIIHMSTHCDDGIFSRCILTNMKIRVVELNAVLLLLTCFILHSFRH